MILLHRNIYSSLRSTLRGMFLASLAPSGYGMIDLDDSEILSSEQYNSQFLMLEDREMLLESFLAYKNQERIINFLL